MQDDSIILNADFPNKDVDYPLPWETDTLGKLIKVGSDPASWLVDELLALDGLSMLLGPPKAGKSSLSRCLVAAVVGMRNNWLGKKVTEHGTVLYISLEERRRTIMDHFAKFSVTDPDDGKIWPMSDVMGHKLIIVKNPTERPDDVYKWLEFQIQEAWCRLVVIDPIIRFLHLNDINDYGSTMQAFDPLIALSRKYSTHICCLHHRRKATALQFRTMRWVAKR